jgi:predicted aspartyl protease
LATTVPLQLVLSNSKLAIPATLDQTVLMLLVDTGSERTLLSEQAVRSSEISGGGFGGVIRGIGGSRAADLATLQRLEIGRLHGSVPAMVTEFNPMLRSRGFSGLIGMDIMGAYDVDLDVRSGQARFYHAEGACRVPRAVMVPPLYTVAELPAASGDPRPHVPVGIAGQTFTGMLDTGSEGVLISPRAARRLGLTDTALAADRTLTISGVGARKVVGHIHLLDSITLGELTVRPVPALVMPENYDPTVDVVLGMDLVRRIHFWLSASSHALVMQYPPTGLRIVGPGIDR